MTEFKIVVTAYNVENTVKNCIWSVHNQSHSNWEMVIVDNNSTDQTIERIKHFVNDIPAKQLDMKKKYRLLKRDRPVAINENVIYGVEFLGKTAADVILLLDARNMFNVNNVLNYLDILYTEKNIIATSGIVSFRFNLWEKMKEEFKTGTNLQTYITTKLNKNHIKNVDFLLKTN